MPNKYKARPEFCEIASTYYFWFQNGTVMATITLKNIPERLYDELKDKAKINHRSLNGEILFALQMHVSRKKKHPNSRDFIERAAAFREKISRNGMLTQEELDKAINQGRA
jgi:hypothetical protein